MSKSLEKRIALVTGAARGIGRGIAEALAAEGAKVVIADVLEDVAAATAEEINAAGGTAIAVAADITDADATKAMVDKIEAELGPIDLLVNNAGVAPRERADILEASPESFDRLISINLKGPYFLSQLVANRMIAHRQSFDESIVPAIVNVGSISAYTASISRGDYCISKAGIAMMTKLFAARMATEGVNVYEIRPGVIATDMTGPVKEKYDKLIFEEDLLPIHRWGLPADIAKAVVAVAMGLMPYSTGQIIDVDGGFHLQTL